MNKFGIFDFLNKTLSSTNLNGILNAPLNSLFKVSEPSQNKIISNGNLKNEDTKKTQNYSRQAILNLIKTHDDLSKKIDAQNNSKQKL